MPTRVISQTIDLTDPNESVTKYITKIDQNGITVHPENNDSRVQINSDGIEFFKTDKSLAAYGTDVRIGDENGFYVKMTNQRLSFYDKDTEVAYISNNQLYITKSVVLKQMDVGTPMENAHGGQWSWKVRENANGLNNLQLKWIG